MLLKLSHHCDEYYSSTLCHHSDVEFSDLGNPGAAFEKCPGSSSRANIALERLPAAWNGAELPHCALLPLLPACSGHPSGMRCPSCHAVSPHPCTMSFSRAPGQAPRGGTSYLPREKASTRLPLEIDRRTFRLRSCKQTVSRSAHATAPSLLAAQAPCVPLTAFRSSRLMMDPSGRLTNTWSRTDSSTVALLGSKRRMGFPTDSTRMLRGLAPGQLLHCRDGGREGGCLHSAHGHTQPHSSVGLP